MKETIWEKRIPTFLGMILILAGVLSTSFLVGQKTSFFGFAAPSETPENLRIANVSDTSFSVAYTTADKVTGSVSYGLTKNFGQTAFDESDNSTKNLTAKNIHLITVKNLKPLTTYYFTIVSGATTFLNDNKPFSQTTAKTIDNPEGKNFEAKGKIIFDSNTKTEGLVFLTGTSLETLATQINTDGGFAFSKIPRDAELSAYASLAQNDILHMLIVNSTQQSTINLLATQTNPVPSIIFSKNYDFTTSTNPVASPSAIIGFPTLVASESASKSPQIISPKKDESFTDTQPLFKGVASPSAKVQIEIHSDEQISTEVTASSNGTWQYRPSAPLSPGTHTISITSRNDLGILKTIKQTFTVYAAGSQVGGNATPSATLSPNPSVTEPPTPTSTIIPTETPIIVVSSPPSPPQNIQSPGNSSLVPLGIGGILTIITGFAILFFSRGGTL